MKRVVARLGRTRVAARRRCSPPPAGCAGDPSYEEVRDIRAEPMSAIVRPEREQVREHQDTGWRGEGGLQH